MAILSLSVDFQLCCLNESDLMFQMRSPDLLKWTHSIPLGVVMDGHTLPFDLRNFRVNPERKGWTRGASGEEIFSSLEDNE